MAACAMESRWSVSPATAPASLMPRAKEKASPGRGRKMAGAAAADAHADPRWPYPHIWALRALRKPQGWARGQLGREWHELTAARA